MKFEPFRSGTVTECFTELKASRLSDFRLSVQSSEWVALNRDALSRIWETREFMKIEASVRRNKRMFHKIKNVTPPIVVFAFGENDSVKQNCPVI